MSSLDTSRVDLWSLSDESRLVEYILADLPGDSQTYTPEPYCTQKRQITQVILFAETGSGALSVLRNGVALAGLTGLTITTSPQIVDVAASGLILAVGQSLEVAVTSGAGLDRLHVKVVCTVSKDA